MLSTAIVARLAKAGTKAAKPLFILEEHAGEEVLKKFKSWSVELVFCPNWSEGVCTYDSLDLGTLECIVLLLYFSHIPLSASVRSSFSNSWMSLCL